ncbi:MAG: CRISPR-associated protein Csx19, partial [Anaerolineae bacterium]
AFIAYSPLGRGMLTGAIEGLDSLAEGDRRRDHPRYHEANIGANVALVQPLKALAAARGCTPAQIAIAWLLAQGQANNLPYLLAHADDGVIWGKVEGEALRLSHEVIPDVSPPLLAVSLQQVRLFGPAAELMLWRSDAGWQARLIEDKEGDSTLYYDETRLLWGTNREPASTQTFTVVSDGQMGHRHAVPIPVPAARFNGRRRPLRLHVRHYLQQDERSGLLNVTLSRLLNVTPEETS